MSVTERDPDLVVDVILTVADERDVDPLELPPLAERIDPDALECLLDRDGDATPGLEVRFHYAGRTVIVRDDDVVVEPGE